MVKVNMDEVRQKVEQRAKDVYYGKTLRKSFARYQEILEMPNLLEVQKTSYQWFLDTGLREVFADVASITDYAGNLELSFLDYSMNEPPKYDVEECKARDADVCRPDEGERPSAQQGDRRDQGAGDLHGRFPADDRVRYVCHQRAERVVVSQIVRSPGIYYGKEIDSRPTCRC